VLWYSELYHVIWFCSKEVDVSCGSRDKHIFGNVTTFVVTEVVTEVKREEFHKGILPSIYNAICFCLARNSDIASIRDSLYAGARNSNIASIRDSLYAGARNSNIAGARNSNIASIRDSLYAGARNSNIASIRRSRDLVWS
jgi:hypothetical protein